MYLLLHVGIADSGVAGVLPGSLLSISEVGAVVMLQHIDKCLGNRAYVVLARVEECDVAVEFLSTCFDEFCTGKIFPAYHFAAELTGVLVEDEVDCTSLLVTAYTDSCKDSLVFSREVFPCPVGHFSF